MDGSSKYMIYEGDVGNTWDLCQKYYLHKIVNTTYLRLKEEYVQKDIFFIKVVIYYLITVY